MKRFLVISGVLLLLALASVGWMVLFVQKPDILAKARIRYNEAVSKGTNLSSGPCLGEIAKDWVLDIAYLPRQPIDDLPENQCPDYLMGRAHHFVEMSPKGEVIRVQ